MLTDCLDTLPQSTAAAVAGEAARARTRAIESLFPGLAVGWIVGVAAFLL